VVQKGLQAMVDHIKTAYPHASILMVSLGDKGYRKDGVWNTEPDVAKVIQVQKRLPRRSFGILEFIREHGRL